MSQKSRPVADVAVGGWTPTPVFSRINEPAPDDGSSVSSAGSPPGDAFEVQLDPVGLPITGAHRVRVRMRRAGPDAAAVRVELRQGATVVASRVFTPGGAFAEYELVLSAAEVDRITDYADLRLRVAAFSAYSSSGSGSGGSGSGGSGGGQPIAVTICGKTYTLSTRLVWTVTGQVGAGCSQFPTGRVVEMSFHSTVDLGGGSFLMRWISGPLGLPQLDPPGSPTNCCDAMLFELVYSHNAGTPSESTISMSIQTVQVNLAPAPPCLSVGFQFPPITYTCATAPDELLPANTSAGSSGATCCGFDPLGPAGSVTGVVENG